MGQALTVSVTGHGQRLAGADVKKRGVIKAIHLATLDKAFAE
jgi:hypothetical protein